MFFKPRDFVIYLFVYFLYLIYKDLISGIWGNSIALGIGERILIEIVLDLTKIMNFEFDIGYTKVVHIIL